MKLQQFFSAAFPRISRSKSERLSGCNDPNPHLSKAVRSKKVSSRSVDYESSSPIFIRSSDTEDGHLFDDTKNTKKVSQDSEMTPRLIQAFLYEDATFENPEQTPKAISSFCYDHDANADFKKAFDNVELASVDTGPSEAYDKLSNGFIPGSLRDEDVLMRRLDSLKRLGWNEKELESWMFDYNDDESCSISRARSKIRTNPWLVSPTSVHQHILGLPNGTCFAEMPSLEITAEEGKFHGIPDSGAHLIKPDLSDLFSLASSDLSLLRVLKKPAMADDSASEGYATSLLQSPSFTDLDNASVEGGDDSALASSISCDSDLDRLDCSLAQTLATCEDYDVHLRHLESSTEQQHQCNEMSGSDVAGTNGKTVGKAMETTTGTVLDTTSEVNSVSNSENGNQSSIKEEICDQQVLETNSSNFKANFDPVNAMGNLDGDKKPTSENDEKLSTRSLTEVSMSLQEKVESLHEQKHYVDAIFHRARFLDSQRAARFEDYRSRFVASRKRAMLKKLAEVQQMLTNQSTRLQTVYDKILSKQWQKAFSKIDEGPDDDDD